MSNLLADWQIRELVESSNMIENFVERQKQVGVLSYGLDGYGYDVRIQDRFKAPDYTLRPDVTVEIDPKRILDILQPDTQYHRGEFVLMKDYEADAGKIRIMPNSFVQVVSVEKFNMPDNVKAFSHFGKSSYSRLALFPIIPPIDEGYSGYITFTIYNPHPVPAILYSNEGIAQLTFVQTDAVPEKTYATKGGKYQGSEGLQGSLIKND